MQRPSFSNSLAPTQRVSFWQFGLVRRFDSVELYGRPCSRKCDRHAVKPPAGSTAAGLRGIGINRRRFRLHAGIWTSPPRRMAAPHFSGPLASPAVAKHPALLDFVPGSAFSDHGHGVDPARAVGGSVSTSPPIRLRHRRLLRFQHPGGSCRCTPGRRLPNAKIWTSWHGINRRLFESRRGWNCVALRRNRAHWNPSNPTPILVQQTNSMEATSC